MDLDVPYKEVCKIKELEEYKDYYVDINGNIYSVKNNKVKKLKPFWSGSKDYRYKKIFLYNKSKRVVVYIHVLVGKLFIPKSNRKKYIIHKTENKEDNSLSNIISTDKRVFREGHRAGRPRKKRDNVIIIEREIKSREQQIAELEKDTILNQNLIQELKILYKACLIKGAHLSSEFDFFNEIISELIDEYANRKGLKKILYQLKNEQ